MNTRFPLTATERATVGHNSRNVRKSNSIPATIYGTGREALSVTVKVEDFTIVYKQAGETHLVDLSVGGKSIPVLIHSVQKNLMSKQVLNVEFLMVNLKEKLRTFVPVTLTGESPAVGEGKGILITTLQEIEIETLPTNIPESISVDVSSLLEVDDEMKVSELIIPTGVEVLTDKELTVVKVGAIVITQEEASTPTETPVESETPATPESTESSEK